MTKYICENCDGEVLQDHRFCIYCGFEFEDSLEDGQGKFKKHPKFKRDGDFYIQDCRGSLMRKIKGYDKALKVIKALKYVAQLTFIDGKKFVIVYAHVPKGEDMTPSQMSMTMQTYKIKANKEYY